MLEVLAIYFEQHPKSHQNQADRIREQLHLAFLPSLAKESMDIVDGRMAISVSLLRQ